MYVCMILKLKAKKMLNKMDALSKLYHCMLRVADVVLKGRNTVQYSAELSPSHAYIHFTLHALTR
jgi:hypothetical protein